MSDGSQEAKLGRVGEDVQGDVEVEVEAEKPRRVEIEESDEEIEEIEISSKTQALERLNKKETKETVMICS